jgi:DNA-directed RNA polymerase subunit RPC12/RpoP
MNDELFVYKCPSCGGKVDYIDNKWHCNYCNNTYNALFASKKEAKLPDYKTVQYNLFNYTCSRCNKRFVSSSQTNGTCTHCNEVANSSGIPFVATDIIKLSLNKDTAVTYFRNELEKYDINTNYCKDLELQYINCDLYNGFVKLSYNGKTVKYVFVNLLIPNLDYDDYRFMYEIGNNGFTHSGVLSSNKQENKLNEIIRNGEYLTNIENKNYENDLIQECINSFSKKYKVKDVNLINVNKNFKIDDGVFIPFYVSSSNINDNVLHHYVFGNESMAIIKKNVFNNNMFSKVIIELPKVENAHKKLKISYIVSKIFRKLMFVSFFILFIIGFRFIGRTDFTNNFIHNLFWVTVCIAIGSFLIYFISNRKYNFYERSVKLSKEEYLNQIINNSNCVKIIKVKK